MGPVACALRQSFCVRTCCVPKWYTVLGPAPQHTDDNGAAIFRQACAMGLEGIVSKRLSAPYRSGPSRDWLKIKNPDSPAMVRAREREW
jgi:hypothetical protein